MKKYLLRGAVGAVLIAALVLSMAPDGSVASNISAALTVLLFSPLLLLGVLVVCFMVYHTIAHGDPLHETRTGNWLRPSDRPREAVVVRKRKTKWCPVCLAKTTCRNTYNARLKMGIHVQGNQG